MGARENGWEGREYMGEENEWEGERMDGREGEWMGGRENGWEGERMDGLAARLRSVPTHLSHLESILAILTSAPVPCPAPRFSDSLSLSLSLTRFSAPPPLHASQPLPPKSLCSLPCNSVIISILHSHYPSPPSASLAH